MVAHVFRIGVFAAAVLQAQPSLPPPLARPVDFVGDVQPIFRKRCSGCHGAAMQSSGLRLDDREAALRGGYSGAVIQKGDSAESKLIHRVAGLHGLQRMPPAGKPLSAEEIAILRAWIDQGAAWPDAVAKPAEAPRPVHWAFQPLRKPQPPPVRNGGWIRNPIDRFILARLEAEGVAPSREADKATLLRRVSLDLTGLPPAPEEISRFLADPRPDAYERAVARLLASPHYGEKWARHWLDLARYADSDGYEKDWVRPWAWRYREWVIHALNQDMPFDRFTLLQLAGDQVPGAGLDAKIATGFHRNTLTNREGGVDNEQFRFENTVDRASTTGTVWMGLTFGCAQCHDHKYDPITQKDFYSLYAFFDNLEEVDIDAPYPHEIAPYERSRAEYEAKRQALLAEYRVPELMADWEKRILAAADNPGKWTDWDLAWDCVLKLTAGGDGAKILRKPPERRTPREWTIVIDHFVRNYHFAVGKQKFDEARFPELDKKLAELRAAYPQLSQAMAVAEEDSPRRTFLRIRGDYKTLGIEVGPAAPSFLKPLQAEGRPSRADLARWLTSRDNPLTARVTVNRAWQEFFGQGLVKTAEDFGTQGDKPSHPELLDWLAAEFIDQGWSFKQLHKMIVTSAAYRQSSAARPDLAERDPDNRLLARQSRLRLSAESIRDSALTVSGLLDASLGGRSVRPPQPKGVAELGYANSVKWEESAGAERYRRGLYIHFQRTTPYPLLMNFDAPKSTVTQCRRQRSNSPLQALNLLNDPVFVEAAQAFARRVWTEAPATFEGRIERAFRLALARPPKPEETARLRQYHAAQKALLDQEPKAVEALAFPSAGDPLEAAAWTGVASVILNLDEFITRE
jgi:mono/diheme cytochrome c family protein